jgi:hypothetical protein
LLRQTQILARQRQRKARLEIAAQPSGRRPYLEAHHLSESRFLKYEMEAALIEYVANFVTAAAGKKSIRTSQLVWAPKLTSTRCSHNRSRLLRSR